jgi:uncharacterized protein (TIGR02594 family)
MQQVPSWYALARREIGTREVAGTKSNPRVLEYYRLTGAGWVKDDAVPWCAAFANAMLALAGVNGTGSLAARSFLKWGRNVQRPYRGCVVVFERGSKAWQGHVGFVEKISDSHVWSLGGNQGDAVNVRRYPMSKVLGFREPRGDIGAYLTAVPKVEVNTDADIWLTKGSVGRKVAEAQRALDKLGYPVGEADGIFGEQTFWAVIAFKKKQGLKPRAVIGPVTWDRLMQAATEAG